MKQFFQMPGPFGSKESALYPLYQELDGYRDHCLERRTHINQLIGLLGLRAVAEHEYSERLFNISTNLDSISIGIIGQEVDAFKADCHSKAKAARELAENMQNDCVITLQKLIE
jgi:hypothetical protein